MRAFVPFILLAGVIFMEPSCSPAQTPVSAASGRRGTLKASGRKWHTPRRSIDKVIFYMPPREGVEQAMAPRGEAVISEGEAPPRLDPADGRRVLAQIDAGDYLQAIHSARGVREDYWRSNLDGLVMAAWLTADREAAMQALTGDLKPGKGEEWYQGIAATVGRFEDTGRIAWLKSWLPRTTTTPKLTDAMLRGAVSWTLDGCATPQDLLEATRSLDPELRRTGLEKAFSIVVYDEEGLLQKGLISKTQALDWSIQTLAAMEALEGGRSGSNLEVRQVCNHIGGLMSIACGVLTSLDDYPLPSRREDVAETLSGLGFGLTRSSPAEVHHLVATDRSRGRNVWETYTGIHGIEHNVAELEREYHGLDLNDDEATLVARELLNHVVTRPNRLTPQAIAELSALPPGPIRREALRLTAEGLQEEGRNAEAAAVRSKADSANEKKSR
jgi:hypothetical protein